MLFALFSWSGRLGRLAYFGYSFLLVGILVVLGLILLLPLRNAVDAQGITIAIVILLALIGICGGFCLAAKRLHDVDMSAWHYAWMILVPATLQSVGLVMNRAEQSVPGMFIGLLGSLLSFLIGLFLLVWPGTDG